ncbi:MAG: MFS transporter [Clostridiales Family XIII bacterium]|jgi:MFS family permease|nr:MFS transporter [Clostridiales Family XIII bacterium]
MGQSTPERIGSGRSDRANYILMMITIFLGYFIFGLSEMVKGPAIPRMQTDLDMDELKIGILLAVNALGYLIACSYTATLARKIGLKRTFMISLIIMVGFGVCIAFSPSYPVLALSFFGMYLGNGMIEITLGVMAAVMFTKNTGTMLNLAHFFYGLGGAVGPIISAGLMAAKFADGTLGWRYMYLIILSWALIPLIPALIGKYKGDSEPHRKTNYREALKNPVQWGVILMLSFSAITEMGIGGWLANYMEKANGLSPEKAALTLTAFFTVFTFARLVLGPLTDKIGYVLSILIFCVIGGVLVIAGTALGASGVVPLVLAGAMISPMYPTVMAVIAKVFRETIDTAMTVTMTVMGFISMAANLLLGGIVDGARRIFEPAHGTDALGMAYSAGIYFLGICLFLAAISAWWLMKRLKKEGRLV